MLWRLSSFGWNNLVGPSRFSKPVIGPRNRGYEVLSDGRVLLGPFYEDGTMDSVCANEWQL